MTWGRAERADASEAAGARGAGRDSLPEQLLTRPIDETAGD